MNFLDNFWGTIKTIKTTKEELKNKVNSIWKGDAIFFISELNKNLKNKENVTKTFDVQSWTKCWKASRSFVPNLNRERNNRKYWWNNRKIKNE